MFRVHILLAVVVAFCAVFAVSPATSQGAGPMIVAADTGFDRWRNGFRNRALAAGIQGRVFDRAFATVAPRQSIIRLDRSQAEFTKTIGQYVSDTVPTSRINAGRRQAQRWRTTLSEIRRRYGVDQQVLMGIWGIETNFGGFMGGTPVIVGLATLAYEGRRRAWAERELIAALRILQSGDVTLERMEGSWAGAMGHTQFMPTSFQAYAEDFRGDGRRDVWADDPADALASAANYLKEHGWILGQPWGIEVRLPSGFNYSIANPRPGRSAAFWQQAGVRDLDGQVVPNFGDAGLWLPMGEAGPAFLVYNNFFVIKRYNRADSYALAVGHLGDRIYGKPGFSKPWPSGEAPLSRRETRELQTRLTALGYDTKGVDGLVGPNSRAAIRGYQRRIGATPDGHPSRELLRRIRRE